MSAMCGTVCTHNAKTSTTNSNNNNKNTSVSKHTHLTQLTMVYTTSLPFVLSSLSLLVVVDVTSAWSGGPRLEAQTLSVHHHHHHRAATTTRRRVSAPAVALSAAAFCNEDENEHHQEEHYDEDNHQSPAVLLSSSSLPLQYPLLPLDLSLYGKSSSILLWVPPPRHNGDTDEYIHDNDEFMNEFDFQQFDNVNDNNDNNDNNDDDDQECSIPDEYKKLSTFAIQAKVMSFLGIQRAKPVSSASVNVVSSSSSFSALHMKSEEEKEEEEERNDKDDNNAAASAAAEHHDDDTEMCHVDDVNCSDQQDCSIPENYKEHLFFSSTATMQANVLSFLGIKRAKAIMTTTTTSTSSTLESSSSTTTTSPAPMNEWE